jgi:hypothetical protein
VPDSLGSSLLSSLIGGALEECARARWCRFVVIVVFDWRALLMEECARAVERLYDRKQCQVSLSKKIDLGFAEGVLSV